MSMLDRIRLNHLFPPNSSKIDFCWKLAIKIKFRFIHSSFLQQMVLLLSIIDHGKKVDAVINLRQDFSLFDGTFFYLEKKPNKNTSRR